MAFPKRCEWDANTCRPISAAEATAWLEAFLGPWGSEDGLDTDNLDLFERELLVAQRRRAAAGRSRSCPRPSGRSS